MEEATRKVTPQLAVTTPDTDFVDFTVNDEVIDTYLKALGCTIWGQGIDISRAEGRDRARQFIWKLLEGLNRTAEVLRENDS